MTQISGRKSIILASPKKTEPFSFFAADAADATLRKVSTVQVGTLHTSDY
jgi:hypothetical protein